MLRVFSLIICLSLIGCASAHNAPNLTPEARTDYNLKIVSDAIGTLQLAAENATTTVKSNGQPILTIPVARKIVQFCFDANNTLSVNNNGWCPIVVASYKGLKNQLDSVVLASPWFVTFETALASQGCSAQ